MHPNDPIEQLIEEMKARPSAELDAKVHRAIDEALAERKNESGRFVANLGRIIMRTRITGWAASAAMVVGLVAVLIVLTKSAPEAFGIERVIEAYNKVRFLHVKSFGEKPQEPAEFWIQSDELGRVVKARYYLPVTEDGAKLITWTPERTELWFKGKRGFVTFQTKRIQPWMQSLLGQSQPQVVLKNLLGARKAGKVDIQVEEPQNGTVRIIAAFKTEPKKEIYYVDPKTELVSRLEVYRVQGGNEVLRNRTEFGDYNAPIDEKMFSIRGELPKDVRIADRLNQIAGVAQGNMTDEQAAVETVRQFFQALIDKDYKKAGLITCGSLEESAREEYGKVQVTAIISIGPAVAQPKWDKHGFKVPCEVEILNTDGQKSIWKPGAYVRPGDDEMHPEYWNITGGINAQEAAIRILPDNEKYAKMTPREAAEAFFKACADRKWDEFAKFCPLPDTDELIARMKESLGGLQIIDIGEPFQSGQYPGWHVPYAIKLPPKEFSVRLSNTNAAKRYVVTGIYDRNMRLEEEVKWSSGPEPVANNDAYARMSPAEAAKAYFEASSKLDWDEMRKFTPNSEVDKTKRQFEEAEKRGIDTRRQIPRVEVIEAVWSAEQSAYLVKCRAQGQVKQWNLALRNDNSAKRFMWDGGI